MQLISTVTTKGQVVIPQPIREKFDIKAEDRILFDFTDSDIFIRKAPTTQEMLGFVKTKQKLTDKQLETVIQKSLYDSLGHQ